jgi:hypothetical protein
MKEPAVRPRILTAVSAVVALAGDFDFDRVQKVLDIVVPIVGARHKPPTRPESDSSLQHG